MRPAVLDAYIKMMPMLVAEDRLSGISDTAAGSGQMKKHDRTQYISKLRRLARGRTRAQKMTLADAEAMGLEVVVSD